MSSQHQAPILANAHLLRSHPPDLHDYEALYKHFHAHPEVSLQEAQTATTIANHPALGAYTVHTSIGGHGLAAVLHNGAGPTILLRAEMDALFVEEKTGLGYRSHVRMTDGIDGSEKPVMHACGHDMHMTCVLAAADWLAKKEVMEKWAGTLVIVFQPNEERGDGARAMVDGGLYDKVPVPDVLFGQHLMPFKAGKVAVKSGTIMAACDSFKVTLFGRGGHGSMPHLCIDPVLLAANVIQRLQGIVAREVDPQDTAVLTIGSVQAGQTENVIADEAVLKIDIRSQSPATRDRVLEAMRRIVVKECEASGCEKPPSFEQTRRFPMTINDTNVTKKLTQAFEENFSQELDPNVATANMAEDFSELAKSIDKPSCFWFLGCMDGGKWEKAKSEGRISQDIPTNHSALFAPTVQPTLKTGVETLCVAALTFLGSK